MVTGIGLLGTLFSWIARDSSLLVGLSASSGDVDREAWRGVFGRDAQLSVADTSSTTPHYDAIVHRAEGFDADLISKHFRRVLPGGLLVLQSLGQDAISQLSGLADALNRGCFDDEYRGPLPSIEHEVKVAVFLPDMVVLARHGSGDETDYLTLGDYGRAYGEGRSQLLGRLRLWEAGLPPTDMESAYFAKYRSFHGLAIAQAVATMVFRLKVNGDEAVLTPRGKKEGRSMSLGEFRAALHRDMSYGLAVHLDRIEVADVRDIGKGLAEVDMVLLPAGVVAQDKTNYPFHEKLAWKDWKSYFRSTPVQPLHVVSQTFREKALMVGDDLSDLYRGTVTVAAVEKRWRLVVRSPSCAGFEDALRVHEFECEASSAEIVDQPVPHSPLYHIFAKEKLDCCIGHGAWGGLYERRAGERFRQEEFSAMLQDGQLEASGPKEVRFQFAEDRSPAGDWRPPPKVARKFAKKMDKVHGKLAYAEEADCLKWLQEEVWERLRPGGLYAFEQDGCYGGFGSGHNFIAANSSATGWARAQARAVASGRGDAEHVQAVFMHKNLIVVQRSTSSSSRADGRGEL